MKVDLIRQKLETLQSQQGSKYANSLWRPKLGSFKVRILPAKWDKDYPFKELFFHYGIGNKTMLALTNFGEDDPIVSFAEGLKGQQYDVENFKLAKKLEPKMRVFAPVIVRGEEDKGVRLWGFGKEVYSELLKLAEDEEVGDFTDILEGRDIIVDITKVEGKTFNNTSVRPRTKTTPLTEDGKQAKLWLETQPDPFEVFDKVSYGDMKKALTEWLSPKDEGVEAEAGDDDDDDTIPNKPISSLVDDNDDDYKPSKPKLQPKTYTLKDVKPKVSVEDQLDELFKKKPGSAKGK